MWTRAALHSVSDTSTENTLKTTMVCKLKYHGSDLESYRWHNAPRYQPNTSSKVCPEIKCTIMIMY